MSVRMRIGFLILFLGVWAGLSPSLVGASSKAVLRADDFNYLGQIDFPAGTLGATAGLARNPNTGHFYTILHSGQRHFELAEFSVTPPSPTGPGKATLVQNWGPLERDGTFLPPRSSIAEMRGLQWDPKGNGGKGRLLCSFGSFYANGKNLNTLCAVTFDTGTAVVEGPWGVDPSIHSDKTKGDVFKAPDSLQAMGYDFLLFGSRGSTAQGQSWGGGVVGLKSPDDSLPGGSTLEAAKFMHWPMLSRKEQDHFVYYSNWQRMAGDKTTYIIGNGDVGRSHAGTAQGGGPNTMILDPTVDYAPPKPFPTNSLGGLNYYLTNRDTGETQRIRDWDNTTKLATMENVWTKGDPVAGTKYRFELRSYEKNIYIADDGTYRPTDGIDHEIWIELPDKHGLIGVGWFAIGYSWYGNGNAHADDSQNGVTYDNNLDSLLYPGKKVHDKDSRGGHAERKTPRIFFIDPDKVLTAAQKVIAGTATPKDLQISWDSASDLTTLGGTVPVYHDVVGDLDWDPDTQTLYMLGHADKGFISNIYVWHVGGVPPPATPPSITTQPASQTVTAGQRATFSVTATGTAPLKYQWQMKPIYSTQFSDITGSTGSSFTTIPQVNKQLSGTQFRCIIKNDYGMATSDAATLTII